MMSNLSKDLPFQKRLLWLNGSLPLIFLGIDLYFSNLGANPPEAIIRTTGVVAIVFLVLTLSATPLSKIFKKNWLLPHKRWLGLWCFYYSLVHLLSYSVFDKNFNFNDIGVDIAKRPFILLGFMGFILLFPLAITSNNKLIKKLGIKNWKKLHKLVYFVPPLVAVHFWLIVKSDLFYPIIFASVLALLLGVRFIWNPRKPALNLQGKN